MQKLFNYIFNPGWIDIFIDSCVYDTWIESQSGFKLSSVTERKTTCILQYSKIRNKYRIIHKGYVPTDLYGSISYINCMNEKIKRQSK